MPTTIRMPEVLAGAAEAAIQSWLVAVGEEVDVGTPIAEVETDKATVEYAAETGGVILKLLVEEGVQVAVGEPIAIIGAAGEFVDDAPAPAENARQAPEPESAVEPGPSPAAETPEPVSLKPGSLERRFTSPLVRRLARERGLDLSAVTGSGPRGRIVRRDLDRLDAPASAAPPTEAGPAPTPAPPTLPSPPAGATPAKGTGVTEVPHTGMRRAIARRLTESKSTVPHFYLVADCGVDALLELRRQVNAASAAKISVNDFVVKAAAGAFTDVPEANAIWTDTAVQRFDAVDMAVAVSIEGGLVTPVLRGVAEKSLGQISAEVSDLAERARSGRLKQHELEGGSFTVSNLGMFGIQEFSAIINPPQSAILAVGRAAPKPVIQDGALAVATVMTVTLSADHRVLDGATAAQWLAAFQRRIENPLSILI